MNDNLLCITFISKDEDIHYSMICKNTDNFKMLESKLYEKYPNIFKYDNIFLLKGNEINRTKSIEENKICNNDIIVIDNSLI